MTKFFKNLYQLLFYGGLTKDEYKRIGKDILQDNRKTLLLMSGISIVAFILAIILYPPQAKAPLATYLISVAFLVGLIILVSVFKYSNFIVNFGIYLFVIVLYMAGIYISAVTGVEDQASTFLVFLIVIPLLFIVRPIIMDITVLLADVFFVVVLLWMKQDARIFANNKLNAVVYGFLSIVIGTIMMKIKMERMNRGWENRYLSETDSMTGLPNRRSFENYLKLIYEKETYEDYTVAVMDINGLKNANDNLGHAVGDELITGAADCIKSTFEKYGKVFRTGGDEFVAVIFLEDKKLDEITPEFEQKVSEWKGKTINEISISSGYAVHIEHPAESIYEMIKLADSKMYEAKAEYYRTKGVDRRGAKI